MSATPNAGNPDRRPLPDGWITRYDENYRAWYYVDTRAQPPRSAWDHPLGAPPPPTSPPGGSFPPPSIPPNRTYPGSSQPYQQQGQPYPGQPPFNQPQSYAAGYQGNQQGTRDYPQQGFPGGPPQPGYAGTTPGNYGNQGWQQQGWQQQPQPQGYPAQPPPQAAQPTRSGRHGGGTGTALLAGGGGLLAGALLTEAFEHHEHREEERAYDEGFNNGDVQGYDDGAYGGGGDW